MSLKKRVLKNVDFESEMTEEKEKAKSLGSKGDFWDWILFHPEASTTLMKMSLWAPSMLFFLFGIVFGIIAWKSQEVGYWIGTIIMFGLSLWRIKEFWNHRNIDMGDSTMWDLLWKDKEDSPSSNDLQEPQSSEKRETLWEK